MQRIEIARSRLPGRIPAPCRVREPYPVAVRAHAGLGRLEMIRAVGASCRPKKSMRSNEGGSGMDTTRLIAIILLALVLAGAMIFFRQ